MQMILGDDDEDEDVSGESSHSSEGFVPIGLSECKLYHKKNTTDIRRRIEISSIS